MKNNTLKNRLCPVCNCSDSEVIMKFSPKLLAEMNSSYRLKLLNVTIKDQIDLITYSRCNDCNMIFCANEWTNDLLTEVYQNVINHDKSKEKIFSIDKRIRLLHIWENTLRVLKFKGHKSLENLKVIDYGSGWGDLSHVISGYGVIVMGYDSDTIKVQYAEENGIKVANSIDELKSNGKVDVFIIKSVLEHVQNVDAILKESYELLKDDGVLVVEVMDYRKKYIAKNVQRLKNQKNVLSKNFNPIEHVNIYDHDSITRTLEKFNYHIFSTDIALRISNIPWFRNKEWVVNLINIFEKLSTIFITGKEMGITIYALKK
jgi:2-polyprenyl-3-methyl-5-hydroxy-6-metoxy-1,4-benzoquinol methylase